jgi:glyoxylase-like metal-dependent hydrolase (beta-lactamase superfamily II)
VAVQAPELHGPPMYFTQDWQAACRSVQALAALNPNIVISGHGRAVRGAHLREALHALARDFEEVAIPKEGKYVQAPTHATDGSAYKVKPD